MLSSPFPSMSKSHTARNPLLPPNTHFTSKEEAIQYAKDHLFHWLHLFFLKTNLPPTPQHFSLDTPFATLPFIQGSIPEELLWYIWSITTLFTSPIALAPLPIYHYLCDSNMEDTPLIQLFQLFAPLPFWRGNLYNFLTKHKIWEIPKKKQKRFAYVFFINRSFELTYDGHLFTTSQVSEWVEPFDWVQQDHKALRDIGGYLSHINYRRDRQCEPLGPIPSSSFPPPTGYCTQHYSPSKASTSPDPATFLLLSNMNYSQEPEPAPYSQHSQDPYEDCSQLDLSLSQTFQTPLPTDLILPQPKLEPSSSQPYPPYCSQGPTNLLYPNYPACPEDFEDINLEEFVPCYGHPRESLKNLIDDSDNDNLSDDHEPICKD